MGGYKYMQNIFYCDTNPVLFPYKSVNRLLITANSVVSYNHHLLPSLRVKVSVSKKKGWRTDKFFFTVSVSVDSYLIL